MAEPLQAAEPRPETVLLLATAGERPEWAAGIARIELAADEVSGGGSGADVIRRAGCVLLDGASSDFIALARRVHALDPAIQVVAVASEGETQAARRALLYAPGLGEVWIASPTDVNGALAERAAGVTLQRRGYERTRTRMERERFTASPQRAERALISDAYLASLLRVLPDAVFSVDVSGRILSANTAAQQMFGAADRDLIGTRLDEALQVEVDPGKDVLAVLRQAAQGGYADVQFRTSRGVPGFGELRAAPLDVQGLHVWAVVLRDVSEHQEALSQLRDSAAELEAANEELQVTTEELMEQTEEAQNVATALRESEHSFRSLADAIPTLAWTARPDGFIDWYNKRWYEYTGSTPAEMEGSGWQAVHHPDVLPRVLREYAGALESGTPLETIFPLRAADGEYRTFLTRMVPVKDASGRVIRWFGTNTDVQVEHEARAAAEEARVRADEANRAKSQFLANMSHELRTPLNAIAGHIQLIDMELYGTVSEQQHEALTRVQRAQEHLLGLINDVLNFAKLESGRVEYAEEVLAVREMLSDVVPLMEPQFAARGVRFSLDASAHDDALVSGDRDKIRQVLLNLLSNAAKFTPAGGTVRVSAGARDRNTMAIMVADTGPGIPVERRESIFEPFVQLRAQYGSPSEGTGLGLAISRDLARGMKGDVIVSDNDDGGSVFTLLLPAA